MNSRYLFTHSSEPVSQKIIGRLSLYRRILVNLQNEGVEQIFSRDLAEMAGATAAQVRRDLMLIGFNGSLKQGYNIRNLIDVISEILDYEEGVNVAIFGLGNFGRALFNYFYGKRSQLRIVATFDSNTEKIGTEYNKVYCYSPYRVEEIVKKKNIKIAILTVPPKRALEVAKKLVDAGIKGILNYTSTPIDVPDDVFLDEYDMITTMEKAAFFVKMNELKL